MRRLAYLVALLCLPVTVLAATPPKVVFVGDGTTAAWTFPSGSNWINESRAGVGYFGEVSSQALASFQAQVVNQHPAIVHIMVGANDAMVVDDATFSTATPTYIANINAMVQEAKAANIKVIIGNIPPSLGSYSLAVQMFNAALAAYATANNIPIINYYDALCSCLGSIGDFQIGTTEVAGVNENYIPLLAPGEQTGSPATSDGALVPTSYGYSLMTSLAEQAITSLTATLEGGWLSDVEWANSYNATLATSDVNTVYPGAVLQFTPVGYYSNNTTQNLQNSNFGGSSGTWTSSNPQVMFVSQTGKVIALSPGTASIKYTPPGGPQFSQWIMYVKSAD
jgi:hypothetical protein